MKNVYSLALSLFFLLFVACGSEEQQDYSEEYFLTMSEVKLSRSQEIDSSVIKIIRDRWRLSLKPFVGDSTLFSDYDADSVYWVASTLKGIMTETGYEMALGLVMDNRDTLRQLGYSIYMTTMFASVENELFTVAVVKEPDQYEIIRAIGTNGIAYEIDNDSLISILRSMDNDLSLQLTGAGFDWCEFTIGKNPEDWNSVAEDIYEMCPDVIDQGFGSAEELVADMQERKMLYLWWD